MDKKSNFKLALIIPLLIALLAPIIASVPQAKAATIETKGPIYINSQMGGDYGDYYYLYVEHSSPYPMWGHWYMTIYNVKIDFHTNGNYHAISWVDVVWASVGPDNQGWKIDNLSVYDQNDPHVWGFGGTISTGWIAVNKQVDYDTGENYHVYNGYVLHGPYAGRTIIGEVTDGLQLRFGLEFQSGLGYVWWSASSWQFLTYYPVREYWYLPP